MGGRNEPSAKQMPDETETEFIISNVSDQVPSRDDNYDDGLADSTYSNVVIDEFWLKDEVVLLGTSDALVMDVVGNEIVTPQQVLPTNDSSSASPDPFDPFSVQSSPNQTARAQSRIIYAYLTKDEAARYGYPHGLVRVVLYPDEMEECCELETPDFYALIRDSYPEIFPAALNVNASTLGAESPSQETTSDPFDSVGGKFREDIRSRIDYVPEVTMFRLRYHDGQTWQEKWSVDKRRRLPVAVEVGFELNLDIELKDLDDPPGVMPTEYVMERPIEQAAPAEILDDEIRSAQTMDIELPNRFVILMQNGKTKLRTPDPLDGSEERF